MTEDALPTDYDSKDGFDSDVGLEQCPHCEQVWSMNGGLQGPAYDQDGREYKLYLDSSPDDGPLFCASCWAELSRNEKQANNQTLDDF